MLYSSVHNCRDSLCRNLYAPVLPSISTAFLPATLCEGLHQVLCRQLYYKWMDSKVACPLDMPACFMLPALFFYDGQVLYFHREVAPISENHHLQNHVQSLEYTVSRQPPLLNILETRHDLSPQDLNITWNYLDFFATGLRERPIVEKGSVVLNYNVKRLDSIY